MKRDYLGSAFPVAVVAILIGAIGAICYAQLEGPTEEQLLAVWDIKAGEVNVAFRNGPGAFNAVTLTIDTFRQTNPVAARALARDIARNLGVIGAGNELDDDALEDRQQFREFKRVVSGLPFSESDRQSIIDTAKTFEVVTEP